MPAVTTYFDYLPKELMDIIHEYNADHRPMFNKVLQELMDQFEEYDTCYNCGEYIMNENTKVTYFRSCKKYAACNSYCMWEINYDFRKVQRLQSGWF